MDGNGSNELEESIAAEVEDIAERIHRAYLPSYLEGGSGRGNRYEDWLREQLDILIISELCDDPERLAELERWLDEVSLMFGIFGASFRILDHIGMHLRGQTLRPYELLPEDETLLRALCQRFLQTKELDVNPFPWLFEGM